MKNVKLILLGIAFLIVAYFGLFWYSAFSLVDTDNIKEKERVECLQHLDNMMHNDKIITLDFADVVDCFIWDSLKITPRGSYKDYPDLNYTIINRKSTLSDFAETSFDWLDGDRNMSYIYFYYEGRIQNNALAISDWAVDFSKLGKHQKLKTPKEETVFHIESETRLDPGIVNPKESDEYIWKTAFFENQKSN